MTIKVFQPPGAYPALSPPDTELYSSALTLSDMEIFVFPDLVCALVLANVMSPRLWQWMEDPWFRGISALDPRRRIARLKQFIIRKYAFNLDLETWGLTTKQAELSRFATFLDAATIARSNALFGYEGDKYYYTTDIRRHFGLEGHNADSIPYWKTETIEAMDAFAHKPGFSRSAGECVSLACLYAAALFVICRIPLESIFIMATPLHMQNYIMLGDGYITNNRHVIPKSMWFNGTAHSAKAQRALRNERITGVHHISGYAHYVYGKATMEESRYNAFKSHLSAFLCAPVDFAMFKNFLRGNPDLLHRFQFRRQTGFSTRWIEAEKVYARERNTPYTVNDKTLNCIFEGLEEDLFCDQPIGQRVSVDSLQEFFRSCKLDAENARDMENLRSVLGFSAADFRDIANRLARFVRLRPEFPDRDCGKSFAREAALSLQPGMTNEEIIRALKASRGDSKLADLSFYAFRDFSCTSWLPFAEAAFGRNPVSVGAARDLSLEHLVAQVSQWPGESIYDGKRMAQPDEVWNFRMGDGAEKALLIANVVARRELLGVVAVEFEGSSATVTCRRLQKTFPSSKHLKGAIVVRPS